MRRVHVGTGGSLAGDCMCASDTGLMIRLPRIMGYLQYTSFRDLFLSFFFGFIWDMTVLTRLSV
jgi:hypothetical protein